MNDFTAIVVNSLGTRGEAAGAHALSVQLTAADGAWGAAGGVSILRLAHGLHYEQQAAVRSYQGVVILSPRQLKQGGNLLNLIAFDPNTGYANEKFFNLDKMNQARIFDAREDLNLLPPRIKFNVFQHNALANNQTHTTLLADNQTAARMDNDNDLIELKMSYMNELNGEFLPAPRGRRMELDGVLEYVTHGEDSGENELGAFSVGPGQDSTKLILTKEMIENYGDLERVNYWVNGEGGCVQEIVDFFVNIWRRIFGPSGSGDNVTEARQPAGQITITPRDILVRVEHEYWSSHAKPPWLDPAAPTPGNSTRDDYVLVVEPENDLLLQGANMDGLWGDVHLDDLDGLTVHVPGGQAPELSDAEEANFMRRVSANRMRCQLVIQRNADPAWDRVVILENILPNSNPVADDYKLMFSGTGDDGPLNWGSTLRLTLNQDQTQPTNFYLMGRTPSTAIRDTRIRVWRASSQNHEEMGGIDLTTVKGEFDRFLEPQNIAGNSLPLKDDINLMKKDHNPAERVARRSVRAIFTALGLADDGRVPQIQNRNRIGWKLLQNVELGQLRSNHENLEQFQNWSFTADAAIAGPTPHGQRAGTPGAARVMSGWSTPAINGDRAEAAVRLNMPVDPFNRGVLRVFSKEIPWLKSDIEFKVPVVVILDPGHGCNPPLPGEPAWMCHDAQGSNTGTGGANTDGADQTGERDIVYDISVRIDDVLPRRITNQGGNQGIVVVRTRYNRENPSRQDRKDTARDNGVDIFLSIHLDGILGGGNRGTKSCPRRDGAPDQINRPEDVVFGTWIAESLTNSGVVYQDAFRTYQVHANGIIQNTGVGFDRTLNDGANEQGNVQIPGEPDYTPGMAVILEIDNLRDQAVDDHFNSPNHCFYVQNNPGCDQALRNADLAARQANRESTGDLLRDGILSFINSRPTATNPNAPEPFPIPTVVP